MTASVSNGWTEYQRLVMSTLELHEKKLEGITATLTDIKVEIGMLKVKSGVWGLVGGIIPMSVTVGLMLMKTLAGHG